MVILVKLKNRLLSKALVGMLDSLPRDRFHFRVQKVEKGEDVPEVVLCDAATCNDTICSRWPDARYLLVDTGLEEQELFFLLSSRKLDGVLTTDMDPELLEKALLAVKRGEFWLPHINFKGFLQRVRETKQRRLPEMKKQDRRILDLISKGRRNREIAEELHLSEQTIKAHVSRIYRILNVSNRAQLVRLVLDNQPISSCE